MTDYIQIKTNLEETIHSLEGLIADLNNQEDTSLLYARFLTDARASLGAGMHWMEKCHNQFEQYEIDALEMSEHRSDMAIFRPWPGPEAYLMNR